MKKFEFTFNNQNFSLPVIQGSEGEKAIDISKLRKKTSLITLDPGYANTGSCKSAITYMNGEKGILKYRGIDVKDLALNSTFKETAWLLIHGKLPHLPRTGNLFKSAHRVFAGS